MNNYIYLAGVNKASLADGIGIRYTIFCSYCKHHCHNCHNEKYWELCSGKKTNIDDIYNDIVKLDYKPDITFSGGDPFFQAESFYELAKKIKHNTNLTIWCYTGFTFEEILNSENEYYKKLLKSVDVLVDGKYIDSLSTKTLPFRGSSNQRIIDVKKSLKENKVILYHKE